VDILIKTQSKFAEPASGDSQRESSKPSESAMYIEMGIALVAVCGLLATAACVWYAANHDWVSSIQRFQEMI
jgi:hypothetical protein